MTLSVALCVPSLNVIVHGGPGAVGNVPPVTVKEAGEPLPLAALMLAFCGPLHSVASAVNVPPKPASLTLTRLPMGAGTPVPIVPLTATDTAPTAAPS